MNSKKERTASGRRIRVAFRVLVALLWVFVAWWYLLPHSADSVERVFCLGIFRFVGSIVFPLADAVPFSLGLVVVLLLLAGFPLLWIVRWIYIRRIGSGSHWQGLLCGPVWLLCLVPVVLTWFLLFWGAGYQRPPLDQRLGLETSPVTAAEDARLQDLLLETIRRDLSLSGKPGQRDRECALAAISRSMASMVEEWDGKPLSMPKGVKASPRGLLLAFGTTGICSPLTLEAHVDGGLPETAFVQWGSHELAHIAGICSEPEATLTGYLAGLRSSDPFARYAVALDIYCSLVQGLPDEERRKAMTALPEEALRDLQAEYDAYRDYSIEFLERLTHGAYDSYLKAQGEEEGIKSYARGTALFIFAWRAGLVTLP